jgi:hypothetical protein
MVRDYQQRARQGREIVAGKRSSGHMPTYGFSVCHRLCDEVVEERSRQAALVGAHAGGDEEDHDEKKDCNVDGDACENKEG